MALLVGALVYALLSDDIHLKYVTAFCLGYILGDIVFKILPDR